MKTIFYWVILSIICGFTLTIASCSDDDDVTSLSAPGDIKYSDISSCILQKHYEFHNLPTNSISIAVIFIACSRTALEWDRNST